MFKIALKACIDVEGIKWNWDTTYRCAALNKLAHAKIATLIFALDFAFSHAHVHDSRAGGLLRSLSRLRELLVMLRNCSACMCVAADKFIAISSQFVFGDKAHNNNRNHKSWKWAGHSCLLLLTVVKKLFLKKFLAPLVRRLCDEN